MSESIQISSGYDIILFCIIVNSILFRCHIHIGFPHIFWDEYDSIKIGTYKISSPISVSMCIIPFSFLFHTILFFCPYLVIFSRLLLQIHVLRFFAYISVLTVNPYPLYVTQIFSPMCDDLIFVLLYQFFHSVESCLRAHFI